MPSFFFVGTSKSCRGKRISATKPLPFVSGTRLINLSPASATTVVTRDTSSKLSMRGEPIKNLTECSPDGRTLYEYTRKCGESRSISLKSCPCFEPSSEMDPGE